MKDHSIRVKYFRAILAVVIIPMIVVPIIGYIYASDLLQSKLSAMTDQSLSNIETSLNHVIDDVISASNVITLDEDMHGFMTQPIHSSREELVLIEEAEKKLHYMEASNLFAYSTRTILVDFNGRVMTTRESAPPEYESLIQNQWYKDVLDNGGFFVWNAPSHDILDLGDGITLLRTVQDSYFNPMGVLIIHIFPESRLRELMMPESEFEGTVRSLLNAEGELILSSDASLETDRLFVEDIDEEMETIVKEIDGTNMFVSVRTIDKTGWKLVQMIPYDSVMKEVAVYRNIMIWLNLVFILLLMFAVYLVTGRLTKSIKQLNTTVNELTEGNLDIECEASGSREVNQLRDSFNYMVKRIKKLLVQVEEEAEQRQAVKLEALQAQINPHFLLNTLNGIKLLCTLEGAPTAEKMLLSLGNLMENTLGKYNDFISLEDELDCLKNYVKLQKMRYGNTFDVTYEIDSSVLDTKVPVLLLQPVIENSIIHAFEDMTDMGTIRVNAVEEKGYLHISVEDNGKGIPKNRLSEIQTVKPRKGKYSSMGVVNVKERIELYYKEPCGLWMESELGQGTKTTMIIEREGVKR